MRKKISLFLFCFFALSNTTLLKSSDDIELQNSPFFVCVSALLLAGGTLAYTTHHTIKALQSYLALSACNEENQKKTHLEITQNSLKKVIVTCVTVYFLDLALELHRKYKYFSMYPERL